MACFDTEMGTTSSRKVPDNVLREFNYQVPVGNIKNKLDDLISNDSEEIDDELSSLSIDNDDKYTLPDSRKLKTYEEARRYKNRIVRIMETNRKSLDITLIHDQLLLIEYDKDTGFRFHKNGYDYTQKRDLSVYPLGKHFLEGTGITPIMRENVINRLFRICRKLSIEPYSVYQAMSYCDRFVKYTNRTLTEELYKYSAIASWYLACKFDLVCYPMIDDVLKYSSDTDSYTILNEMELAVLDAIDYNLSIPTPIIYLRSYTITRQVLDVSHQLSKFLIDTCLLEHKLSCHPSFVVAAACYLLGLALSERNHVLTDVYPDAVAYMTGLTVENLFPVILDLIDNLMTILQNYKKIKYVEILRRYSYAIEFLSRSSLELMNRIRNKE